MSDNTDTISIDIRIGGQSFRIRIAPEEQAFFEEVARYTEKTHDEISRQAVAGGAQVWAMTAFQLARELLQQRGQMTDEERERINRMIERIEKVSFSS